MADIDLHVHPFLGNNSLTDVVKAMDNTSLGIAALESFDKSIYPFLVEQAKSLFPSSQIDSAGIRLPNGKYLLNAGEYGTKEDIHVLTLGYSFDSAQPAPEIRKVIDASLGKGALIMLDHPFVDNTRTKMAGHVPEELERQIESLCREYSGKIALEWNGYCIPWMRLVLKHCLNAAGFDFKYHNVNKKAEELSAKLRAEGYNVPVVADTDLHARTKRHLQHMGTSRIVTEVSGETASEVVESLRNNIFNGNYKNIKRYVGFLHMLDTFCMPKLFFRTF